MTRSDAGAPTPLKRPSFILGDGLSRYGAYEG